MNEYENAGLVENNIVDDKITNLDINFVKENNETTNRFNSRVLDLINNLSGASKVSPWISIAVKVKGNNLVKYAISQILKEFGFI